MSWMVGGLTPLAARAAPLSVTRMYVDSVAKDLQDGHRRASPGDNLRVRRRA